MEILAALKALQQNGVATAKGKNLATSLIAVFEGDEALEWGAKEIEKAMRREYHDWDDMKRPTFKSFENPGDMTRIRFERDKKETEEREAESQAAAANK